MDCIIEKLDHGWRVVSREQELQLPKGELPYGEAASFDLVGQRALQIGERRREPVWLVQLQWRYDMGSIHQVIDFDIELFQLAGCGVQLVEFYRSHKYCSYYEHKIYPSKTEWAMLCSHYHERYYSRIAPCIIVAICRDDSILLAQRTRHRNGVHTVLAGFVEVGETLEQAVAREVMEESGAEAKNLRYMTPRLWPFLQSLMTAFMAECDNSEIVINPKELFEAHWYRYDDLPLLPPPSIMARRLVGDTVAIYRAEYE